TTGVTVDSGSFSIPPNQIVPGVNSEAVIWNLNLAPGASQQITWLATIANLQPGQVQMVALGGSLKFVNQGTNQQVALAPLAVAGLPTVQSIQIPVLVRSPEVVAISQAAIAAGQGTNTQLASTLSDLGDAVASLQAAPTDAALLGRVQFLL